MLGMVFLAILVCFCGCGSGSSTGDTPQVTDLSQLPKATSPMASASANLSRNITKGNGATTGLNIRTTDLTSFSYLSSMGACNTFNMLKQGVNSASQADMILCFVSSLNNNFSSGVTDADGNPVTVDIYDGNYHIFNMNIVGDTGAPDRVKMKIVKTGNSITEFKMWMCKKTGADVLYQNEYTDQAMSGSSITMNALGLYSEGGNSGRHYVHVTGSLDANRVYTTKTITTKNWNTQSVDPTSWSETILTQTPGAFSFSGYNKGSWSSGEETGTYEDTSVGLGQMIGDTGALTALAMGDGAVKYTQGGTSGAGEYSQSGTNPWNGDTTYPELPADNDYYATADADTYTVPEVQATVSADTWIAFSADQTWDCTDDVGVGIYNMPESNYTTLATECSEYSFDHNWINCYTVIGSCNGDNACYGKTGDDLTACRACFTDGNARKAGTETEDCLNTNCAGNAECLAGVAQMCTALP